MNIKANKYTVFFARTLAIVFCVISLMMFVAMISHAQSINGVDFSNQPYQSGQSIHPGPYVDYTFTVSNGNGTYYAIIFRNYSGVPGTLYWGFAVFTEKVSNSTQINGGSNWNVTDTVTYNGTNYLYKANYNYADSSYSASQFTVPTYDINGASASQYIEAALNDINGSGSSTTGSIDYSLPPGNLAIITTTASYESIKLSTTMPLQSSLFSGNPWPNTTQRIGTYNTLPASLNASTLGSVIEWQRTGDANLFGQTHSAEYQARVLSKFTYIVISNPYYYPANNMDDNQYTNGAITISLDDVVNIEIRNLTASINPTTGEVENTENGTTWIGEIDGETGDITWTDNDGGNTNPSGGGNLSDATITGFQSWLKGILTSIRDIFEPAHDAIQTLSGSVRNFANWLYALYIWLPSPVLNLLTSAISLAIVIGVIKVFI